MHLTNACRGLYREQLHQHCRRIILNRHSISHSRIIKTILYNSTRITSPDLVMLSNRLNQEMDTLFHPPNKSRDQVQFLIVMHKRIHPILLKWSKDHKLNFFLQTELKLTHQIILEIVPPPLKLWLNLIKRITVIVESPPIHKVQAQIFFRIKTQLIQFKIKFLRLSPAMLICLDLPQRKTNKATLIYFKIHKNLKRIICLYKINPNMDDSSTTVYFLNIPPIYKFLLKLTHFVKFSENQHYIYGKN